MGRDRSRAIASVSSWTVPLGVAHASAKSSFRNQLAIVGRKHTWIMAFIYIGTFGSFIGYSAAFPLLIKTQFPAVTIAIAFLGPLVGSLSRPLGGLLADKVGGAIVTVWNFIAMAAATIGVLYFVIHGGGPISLDRLIGWQF